MNASVTRDSRVRNALQDQAEAFHAAVQAGMTARRSQTEPAINPYTVRQKHHAAWEYGWRVADDQLKGRP